MLKKLRKAKKDCGPYDKPDVVKTHLRDMLIMPEMIGSVIGVHNGKVFTSVEVKADMVRCHFPHIRCGIARENHAGCGRQRGRCGIRTCVGCCTTRLRRKRGRGVLAAP